jgi:hypothetical protein
MEPDTSGPVELMKINRMANLILVLLVLFVIAAAALLSVGTAAAGTST